MYIIFIVNNDYIRILKKCKNRMIFNEILNHITLKSKLGPA